MQQTNLKKRRNDIYGTISIAVFWLTLLWWILALVYAHSSKPYIESQGIIRFVILGIVLPGCGNLIGVTLGVIGLSSLSVKSHKRSFFGTIANLGLAILAVPVLILSI